MDTTKEDPCLLLKQIFYDMYESATFINPPCRFAFVEQLYPPVLPRQRIASGGRDIGSREAHRGPATKKRVVEPCQEAKQSQTAIETTAKSHPKCVE
jgi:hypothetical protein